MRDIIAAELDLLVLRIERARAWSESEADGIVTERNDGEPDLDALRQAAQHRGTAKGLSLALRLVRRAAVGAGLDLERPQEPTQPETA